MKRVTFYTLGCKLNFAETGTIRAAFEKRDFEVVPFGEPADVAVINTCTVTEEADRKCRQVIRRAQRANEETFIIVTGCYAQLRPDDIARIDGVDAVFGAREKFDILNLLDDFSKKERTQIEVSCIDQIDRFGPAYNAGDRSRAFLKIQDGCDYTCSFCTIPLARGKSRSQTITRTITQAQEIATKGYKEIVLSGINLGLFGQDRDESLLDLLYQLDALEGIHRYRISSIEPNLLTDSIIEFVAASKKFQPHVHIPLQSGSDEVLAKMRRRYRSDVYRDRVTRIKTLMPHACIGADVIVGFPAESDAHFQRTVDFIEDLPVSYLHVFTYSERPNTTAVDHIERVGGMPVPKQERSRRNRVLRVLSDKKRRTFYDQHIGQTRLVYWESSRRNGNNGVKDVMHGFTDNYIKVERPFDESRVHTIEDVYLDHIGPSGHMGLASDAFISLLHG